MKAKAIASAQAFLLERCNIDNENIAGIIPGSVFAVNLDELAEDCQADFPSEAVSLRLSDSRAKFRLMASRKAKQARKCSSNPWKTLAEGIRAKFDEIPF